MVQPLIAKAEQHEAEHFTDAAENTFRTIGILTPEQLAKVVKDNNKRYSRERAAAKNLL